MVCVCHGPVNRWVYVYLLAMCVQINTHALSYVSLSTLFVIKSIPTISEVEKMYGRQFEETVWLGQS